MTVSNIHIKLQQKLICYRFSVADEYCEYYYVCVILYGEEHFFSSIRRVNASDEDTRNALWADARAFGIFATLGAMSHFIICLIAVNMVNYAGLKQICRIREKFLESILRQEMAWFDTSAKGNFVTQLNECVSYRTLDFACY